MLAVNKSRHGAARPRGDRRHRRAQAAPAAPSAGRLGATGRGLEQLLQLVTDLQSRYTAHIPTGALNRALSVIAEQRTDAGQGTQEAEALLHLPVRTAPPRFAIAVNDRDLVTRDFGFYVENRLREALRTRACR